jgi:hypothetical protein
LIDEILRLAEFKIKGMTKIANRLVLPKYFSRKSFLAVKNFHPLSFQRNDRRM